MGLKDEVRSEVSAIFQTKWKERDGLVVPTDGSVTLGNDAVKLSATVLYADLADSTKLVDGYKPFFAAEVYKAFLYCAAKIVRSEGGVVTAYDGDRIMAVYIDEDKNTRAVRSALKINWAAKNIVQTAMNSAFPGNAYALQHVVGVDTSSLFIAKTGAIGANDLVWVGRAANYAAKLSALSHAFATYITKEVYDAMQPSLRTASDGRAIWEARTWTAAGNRRIYCSSWWIEVP